MIDLQAHWWGRWIVPGITLFLTVIVAKLGGVVIRRNGARPGGHRGVWVWRLAESEAVARMFQGTFLILTTLMVLGSMSSTDRLSDFLSKAYWLGVCVLFAIALREGRSRGMRWIENAFLLAMAFGFALSLTIGIIANAGIDHAVNEYVQSH